jgi:protein TonB
MELRKMPHLDLGKKRSTFLNIGLAISLALTLMAFEWKSIEEKIVYLPEIDGEPIDVIEMPLTDIPPPPPPPIQQPQIIEKPDDEEINEEVEVIFESSFEDETVIEDIVFQDEPPLEVAEEYVDWASQMPVPLNGLKEYYKFISKNIKYPNQARRMGIEGKVFVQFVVNKEGAVTGIKTVKGIGAGCDEEAERVIGIAPHWKPGKQGARRVNVRMILPIHFNLN